MTATRRRFLLDTTLGAAALAVGCQSESLPAFLRRSARTVTQILPGLSTMDGAGVHLTRLIGQPALDVLDPFVLLDRMHSDVPGDYVAGFPDHPHRGFETVTVMLEGQMRHHDSRGNHGLITGGGAQWMTAGRGLVHSEMPEQQQGWLSGFQLWINLPAKEKMCQREYQDLAPEKLAEGRLSSAGSLLRVIAGETDGLVGPVHPRATEPLLLTATLEDDRPLEIDTPNDHAGFVFVHTGAVEIGPENKATTVAEGSLALLTPGRRLRLRATGQRAGVLVAAARPLREPIVRRGPFVMNTEAEIGRAFADYRSGLLARE